MNSFINLRDNINNSKYCVGFSIHQNHQQFLSNFKVNIFYSWIWNCIFKWNASRAMFRLPFKAEGIEKNWEKTRMHFSLQISSVSERSFLERKIVVFRNFVLSSVFNWIVYLFHQFSSSMMWTLDALWKCCIGYVWCWFHSYEMKFVIFAAINKPWLEPMAQVWSKLFPSFK